MRQHFTGMTQTTLRQCLEDVPPLDLLGMQLLAERRTPGQLFPRLDDVSREVLGQAVEELVAYTDRCLNTCHRLAELAPIPLTCVAVPEFGL